MSFVDASIIIIYMLLMLCVGYFSGRSNKDQDDYFLAKRSMPWIPVALSVAATMISANGFIGGPGWTYNDGMYPFMVNVSVPLAVFVALYITMPVLYQLNVTSIYEYVELRFGSFTRVLTVLQFIVNSLIQVSSMVFIPALVLQIITGWSLVLIVVIVVIISIIYTLLGGIRAVIWTDSIQVIIITITLISVLYILFSKIGLGFFTTLDQLQSTGKLNTFDFSLDITVTNTFWATVIGGSVMWIRYFCFDQVQVQRLLTSKSINNAKNSLLTSAIIMNVMYYVMLFIGVLLFIFYNGKSFELSNEIMINFILNELPIGIIGIAIAGIFASAMSSIDSLLNSMTTVFTKDIYEKYFIKEKRKATLYTSKIITAVIGIVIIFIIIWGFNGTVKSVLDVVGSYISYFSGPAAGVFILAMFTTKANDKGTAIGFIAGLILGYFISKYYNTSWLWNPFIGAIITIISGYVLSIFTIGKNTEENVKYTAIGLRKKMLENNKGETLPFTFGKQEKIVLIFFVLQFVVLALIQY